jgi:uncharacterized protein (TIGR02246 family)
MQFRLDFSGALMAITCTALVACSGDMPSPASAVQPDTLAKDRMAVEETLRRYVRALDDSDLDAYLATLTEDASFLAAEGNHHGKAAIRAYVEPVMQSRLQRREKEGAAATATHHVVTNQSIEFTDPDNALVRGYWMFVVAQGAGKPLNVSLMGSSEDYLTRQDGQWLIRERRVAP